MHNLHDDLIPLYHTMTQAATHAVPPRTPGPDLHGQYEAHAQMRLRVPWPRLTMLAQCSAPARLNRILLVDTHSAGDYFALLQLFSDRPVLHVRDLSPTNMYMLKVRHG